MTNANVTLLIVDNDPSIRYSLSQIFRCMGHSVRSAEDGFYALQAMAEAIPDVLLSDLNMPRMSGFELLSVVRRRFPSVYVIAMSGANQRGTLGEGIAADGVYQKTPGVVSLLQAVQNGIDADRFAVRAARKAAPIWVPQTSRHDSEGSQVFIGCPECLRAFPHLPAASGLAQETFCAHCQTPINYAVVEQFA